MNWFSEFKYFTLFLFKFFIVDFKTKDSVTFIIPPFMKTKSHVFFFLLLKAVLFSNIIFSQQESLFLKEGKELNVVGNEIHSYKIPLRKGDFFQLHLRQKNVNILAISSIPEKDTLQGFLGNYRKDGLEIVEFPIKKSDTYTIKISPYISPWLQGSDRENFINNIHGGYVIEKFKIFSPKEYKALLKFRKAQQDSVISWVTNKSITLKSVKAETGFEDLLYLKPLLKDVHVVGMGETSHGTREIFQMKHRMLEFLVKEMGFTLFGIEASNVGCRPINDYVLYGKGNSRDALSAQGFWIWNVEAVIDMIEWMYEYNKTVPMSKKVKFIGVDTQTNGLDLAYNHINSYIKNEDHPLLDVNVDSLFQNIKTIKDRSDLSTQRQQLYTLLSYTYVNKSSFIAKSSREEYFKVLSDLKKIIQGLESVDGKLRKKVDYNIRDEYMAQTVLEVLEKEGPNAKMMVWAHNGHIKKDHDSKVNGSSRPLGSVLRRYLGEKKYYAIGFSTYQGTFRARNIIKEDKGYKYLKTGSFKIFPRKDNSLDWYFAQSKKDMFFINFNQYPNYNALHSFMNKQFTSHSAGANWTFGRTDSPIIEVIPSKYYNGMIFIKETSSSILTPGGEKEIEKRIEEGR